MGGGILSNEEIKRYQEALTELAEGGLVSAQYNLGISLILDSGDFAAGFKWIEAAARGGDYTAQAWAGVLLMYGLGVAQDMPTGKEWLDKAINCNDSSAFSTLHLSSIRRANKISPQKTVEIGKWLMDLADRGDPSAPLYVGMFLERNQFTEGTPYDWYLKAIERGMPQATVLAESYSNKNDIDVSNDLENLGLYKSSLYQKIVKWRFRVRSNKGDYFPLLAAKSNYGPIILKIFFLIPDSSFPIDEDREVLKKAWLNKLLSHDKWYEISGYAQRVPDVIGFHFSFSHRNEMRFARDNYDGFTTFFKAS
jgi:hypothetical protein